MKKIAKVWVLCLTLASSLVALLVSATWEFTSKVSLTLTEWENTCILNDYMFAQKVASPADQLTEPVWEIINCIFLSNSQINVSLRMSNLTNSDDVIIPSSWFSWHITSGNTIWLIWALEDQTLLTLDNQPMIYTKAKNAVWEWSWTMTLQWIIPGWTPGWTYTGTIDLILQVVE